MEVRQVFVSSENRDTVKYPYGNAYTLHLTQPIKDIHKVELLYASVPNVLYNLTEGSNVLTMNVNGASNTFSLTPGFYNSSTLATEITFTVVTHTGVDVQYIIQYGNFLFTNPYTTPSNLPFTITINSSELADMLGFDNGVTYLSQISTTPLITNPPLYNGHVRYLNKNWIQSTKIVNLAPNEGIFLDIHELRTMFNEDALAITGNTYTGQNVSRTFGLIPMDVTAGAIKHFQKSTDYDFCVDYVNPIRKLDRLSVEWIDRRGRKVHFNGLEDNSFVLRFHTLRNNL